MPKPVASWNPARGVWETENVALCGHSEPFSETWPSSGTTRNGVAYALPTSALLTAGSVCSSTPGPVFDTPDTNPEALNGGSNRTTQPAGLGNQIKTLPTPTLMDAHASGGSTPSDVTLTDAVVRTDLGRRANDRHLPPPTASDYKGSTAARREPGQHRGQLDAVAEGALLPTPTVSDTNGPGAHGDGGADLRTAVDALLLPTPRATDGTKGGPNQAGSSGDHMLPSAVQAARWGAYAPAVARWETITRPAPDATEATGKTAAQRLSPRFVEWMMGLPEGHVTAVPGLGRNEQLKALGNGVVPQQAEAATLAFLTDHPGVLA